jgi:hypothetical protein
MRRETVVVLVRSSTNFRRSDEILSWLRRLLPTALLVIAPAALPSAAEDVITIDADAVESGPLSLADALARASHAVPIAMGGDGGDDRERSRARSSDGDARAKDHTGARDPSERGPA